jgi:ABC-type glutathione transport system ATPase component
MVADLDPHDGDVSLDGVRRSNLPAATWRSQVGFLPARCGWWDERIDAHFVADTQDGRFPLATALLLPGAIFERGVDQASTGERQRLGLIRALLAQPRVLLLDEPTASLDPVATAAVESLLMARRALGMSLVIVTHDVAQAKRMGHEHRHMRDGALVPA